MQIVDLEEEYFLKTKPKAETTKQDPDTTPKDAGTDSQPDTSGGGDTPITDSARQRYE